MPANYNEKIELFVASLKSKQNHNFIAPCTSSLSGIFKVLTIFDLNAGAIFDCHRFNPLLTFALIHLSQGKQQLDL